ncbi:PASTA domain-containing protein [Ancylomarina euxinus]|uniref:PASTA domain-containing protein n=1 Tax=Ancylomarina euxinus TaxID=2283627 RepID=A0A425Y4Y3_9BACT|nr:PASTA domain-containing protein [Ancylomarina euxinus]MCZ4694456.1 PASTA domain-containing protein [Ancylomarina euxinus]MUP16645.1 PASTA domain-containing protein [Ancylomarina euxinus]RRG23537.1 PASTA domain-containing protein [Ancylomarina euxinus]
MRLRQFFKSGAFYKHLGLSIIISVALVWITLQSLSFYTNHGEEIKVPNLYSLSLEDGTNLIDQTNLRYTIYDSVYNSSLPAGCILDQSPKANSLVKRNRNLFLTINSLKPEQIRFPNLIDNSFRQAYEILITNGFKIGKLNYVDYDYYNLVLYPEFKGDSIKQGDLIDKGSQIDLVLGKGKNIRIQTPELIGKYYDDAKERILLSSLNIGRVSFDSNVMNLSDSLNAQVYQQSHAYKENSKIAPGSKINLWLTTDSLKIKDSQAYLKSQLK